MTIMMNGSDSDAYMEGYRKIIDGFNESKRVWSKGRNSERNQL